LLQNNSIVVYTLRGALPKRRACSAFCNGPAEDTPVTIAVLNGDTDPDGDPLGVIAVGAAAHGRTSLDGQTAVYRPAQDFVGADTFTYTVSDGVLTAVGQVTLTITPVNDPPTAVADHVYTMHDTPIVIDVLANDTDVDSDRVNVSAVITATQQGGTASLFISPAPGELRKVVYTPTTGFWGSDVLTYTLTNGALTSTGRVTVTVNTAALNLTKTVSTAGLSHKNCQAVETAS